MSHLARIILRFWGVVLLSGVILTLVSAYYTGQLYLNLRPDLEELLPEQAQSVKDLGNVRSRLRTTDHIVVIALSEDTQASKRFMRDLATKLRKVPSDVLTEVEYQIKDEIAFFQKRRALYLDTQDLLQIKDYVRKKIRFETELYNPLNIFRETELPEPIFDFLSLQKKYANQTQELSRFKDGTYASPDLKTRALIAHLPGGANGVPTALALQAALDNAIKALDPQTYAQDLQIKFTGGARNLIEEHYSLLADLELSTLIVIILVTLAMILYYQSVRAPLAILISLFMGTFWTFAISFFWIGYLNANSAFLGAIVIGNGINFGIIYLARYLEERRKGVQHIRATYLTLKKTWMSTWTAALAAGLAYGSLVLTQFRGFSQFGKIGFLGMILCWVSAFTVLPAVLTFFEKIRPFHPKRKVRQRVAETNAWVVKKFHRSITFATLLFTFASLFSWVTMDREYLESDLSKLRDKVSLERGSGYNEIYIKEVFGKSLLPLVALAPNPEKAKALAEALRQKSTQDPRIQGVRSFHDFFPKNQKEKIKILKEIKRMLKPNILRRMSPQDRALIREYLTPEVMNEVTPQNLPHLVKMKFSEKTGEIGNLVFLEVPFDNTSWSGDELFSFIKNIRDTTKSIDPKIPLAGQLPVSSDMIESVTLDGPKATFFAFLAVSILVVLLFRQFKMIFLVLTTLFIGILWLIGAMIHFDLKINFLNFIALPITFGIGVDYGVNIFHRFRMEGRRSVMSVIRHTGGAVILASTTTIIGFGSLIIANNQAFVSFGRLAVLGEVTCLLAAVCAIPACVLTFTRREKK